MKDKLFCVGQKALIEKNGKVLILHDPVTKTVDLPGGKIQEGEYNFTEALKREVGEETTLTIEVIQPFRTGYYEIPANIRHRNSGKKIFTVYFICQFIKGKIKLSEEHNWYKWVNKSNFKQLFKTKTDIYRTLDIYLNKLNKL